MIQLLDQNTIDKIAAGEVVERPRAVVKELVENSIDAGATAITVEIKEGGISFIRITDNGKGIEKDEIPLAFLRHATSKIKKVEDLLSVTSLGFRGEALSSISAVSRVELITKTKSELCGYRYEINGGVEKSLDEIGCPEGTTIISRELFYNTPARRKFLKSKTTEGGYINEVMEHFALSHPDIRFTFIMDGKTKIQTAGNGQTDSNIYYIYGADIAKKLIAVENKSDNMRLSIKGYVGKPEISRGNRGYMNYFINGRTVRSAIIDKAIELAYKPYTMTHKYPFTSLDLVVPSEEIDVNVHPTKMEVRFENQEYLFDFIYHSISNALKNSFLIPSVTLDPVKEIKPSAPVTEKQTIPAVEPFEKGFEKKIEHEFSHLFDEEMKGKPKTAAEPFTYQAEKLQTQITSEREQVTAKPPAKTEVDRTKYQQETFELNELVENEKKVDFRIIGQVFATYWLIQYKDELLIIDQHAAHEKVLYENLVKKLSEQNSYSQNLVAPIIVSLSVREEEILNKHKDVLCGIGYVYEPFGGKEYAIKAVPSDFLSLDTKDLFLSILDELMDSGKATMESVLEKCASMACKAAIKGNDAISYREAEELIRSMLTLDNPYNCPHGRPTTISMSKQDFEKKFKRIV